MLLFEIAVLLGGTSLPIGSNYFDTTCIKPVKNVCEINATGSKFFVYYFKCSQMIDKVQLVKTYSAFKSQPLI